MKKLVEWVIPFVIFGPIIMLSFSPSASTIGTITSAVGALMLGVGCGVGFRCVGEQGREIERLRALLQHEPPKI